MVAGVACCLYRRDERRLRQLLGQPGCWRWDVPVINDWCQTDGHNRLARFYRSENLPAGDLLAPWAWHGRAYARRDGSGL